MTNDAKAAEILNDFVDDVVAGRIPRVYAAMANALGLEVDTLLELMPLFECVQQVEFAARIRPVGESGPATNGAKSRARKLSPAAHRNGKKLH